MGEKLEEAQAEAPDITRLEHEIQQERAELAENLSALEQKASRATNWRYQVGKRPAAILGAAFFVGLTASKLIGGTKKRRYNDRYYDDGEYRKPSVSYKRSALRTVQSAVVGLLAHEARRYFRSRFFASPAREPEYRQREYRDPEPREPLIEHP